MRFGVWQHLPLENGLFWIWSVRSQDEFGWTPWQNRNFVYYGDGGGTYTNVQTDVTDLLSPVRTHVQMSLGAIDLAATFAFPGNDATPSPTFDNVSFWRYNLGGPAFSTRNIDLFQDSFPNGGGWLGELCGCRRSLLHFPNDTRRGKIRRSFVTSLT